MADSRGRYTGPEVKEVRNHYWDLMPQTRQTATDARAMLAGKSPIVLPDTVRLAGAEAWISDLPHKRMAPQRVRQKLISKRWELKRPVTSGGPRAASVATRIAQPANAIMRDENAGFAWTDVNDLLLIEGIAFSTVNVTLADWRKKFSLYEDDAKSFEPKHLHSRYAIDKGGRFRGDDDYDESTVDLDQARKDMEAESTDHRARHLPFRQPAYSIRTCAPIWGADFKLEGLVVETHWTASNLRQRGLWVGKAKDGSDAQLYPLGAIGEGDNSHGASGKPVVVTEVWALDDERLPYVTFCVEGWEHVFKARSDKSGVDEYVIDLARLCKDKRGEWRGFTRLPISWGIGLGWSPSDMDERAMSFMAPFLQSYRNIDSLVTSLIMASQMMAFPPLVEKVPFVSGDDTMDDDEPNTPDLAPGKITRVAGDVTQIQISPPPFVLEVIGMLLGENKTESEAGGSGSAGSGIQLSLAEAFNEDALTTVHESVLKMASQNGSYILEAAAFLGECYEPIRVYQLSDVLLEQTDPSDTNQIMTLDPGLIGTSFDIKAVNVKVPGENPAVRQQNAALVKEGFYDKRWFLEQDGYPAPQEMLNRVAWQEVLDSDVGKAAIVRLLEQFVENKFLSQIQEAIAAKTASPQGLPAGYADGTSPPPDMLQAGPQAGAGMAGLTTPNPAAASLGATVNAGLQAGPLQNIAAAGGVLPSAPLQTAGV